MDKRAGGEEGSVVDDGVGGESHMAVGYKLSKTRFHKTIGRQEKVEKVRGEQDDKDDIDDDDDEEECKCESQRL